MNARVLSIQPSVTLGINAIAKKMQAQGRTVWSFAAGEPDFDTPAHIKAAAAEALLAGRTKYAPTSGIDELREAIAAKLHAENGLSYKPGQVIVSNGAKESLFNAIASVCGEGDEVVVPSPYWLSYPEMIRMAGGRSVFVPCAEANDFKMTPEQLAGAITPRTCAVIINSPSNPCGNVYTRDELTRLAEVLARHDVFVISDEIYEKLIYDGAVHASIGSLAKGLNERTITVNGFSKAYSMTGWRLGYMAGPPAVISAAGALQSHSTSGANSFAQYGALAALRGPQSCVTDMVAAFAERRRYLHERLTAMPGIQCIRPSGAFYMLPNISRFGMGSVQFCERLLESHGVAAVPGLPFGSDDHLRLSYACSMQNIREGMDQLERFVRSL